LDTPLLAFIALTFVLAGFVKGVIGLGLPTIAVGLLGAMMAPAEAAALMVLPSLVTNVWQISGPALAPLSKRLWPMLVALIVGVGLGTGPLAGAGTDIARGLLGLALVVYAALGLLAVRSRVPASSEGVVGALAGLATGVVTAATGIFVIPSVPYLQALGLEKDELVQALGITFLVATLALAASLAFSGALSVGVAGGSLLALAPALAGMWLGQRTRAAIDATTFRRCFLFALLLLGAHLAWRAFV
jgi:uncharacterized membrane protein YfcA